MSPAEYCREIETYLCRKNEGHLIRIVGPVFEKVCGWAAQGVPIKIAYRGIDRYVERQQAKGPRRRPVRVEFCEADILDAFDEWRRAVGVSPAGSPARANGGREPAANGEAGRPLEGGHDEAGAEADGAAARRKPGLQTHVDRVMARLTQRRVEAGVGSALGEVIERVLGELDTMRAGARGARNEARAALLSRLEAADRELIAAARAALETSELHALRQDAWHELEPFRSRLQPDAFEHATEAALDRLVRDRWRLPSLRLDV